jgi:alkyl sulfatase BDS1-like metallo-beta-lactamase superfamily hydrolase
MTSLRWQFILNGKATASIPSATRKEYRQMPIFYTALYLLLVFSSGLLGGCQQERSVQNPTTPTPADLTAHSAEFKQGVEKVTDGVYVAIGFGLANSIMLEGDDGLIIVDTMESMQAAKSVLAAFRTISNKPVKAIIYTHNHADHVFGAAAFADSDDIPVYAHETTEYYIDRVVNVLRPIIAVRSARMFGSYLEGAELENAGIGPFLNVQDQSIINALRPNQTFRDKLSVTVAGIDLELVHAPGETNDQLFVWLPDKQVLLPGDNIYRSFPNLYTIRGTPNRDVNAWVESLDKMRNLQAAYLVPSHSRPLAGKQLIFDTLTDYRDAIQYVHDQSVRGINLGLTPDQLVEFVKLPAHLAKSPFLQEFYGKVAWSVRAIFTGYLGWFDGNSSQLLPLDPKTRAEQMVKLAGGEAAMLDKTREAAKNQQYQWLLELSDHLLALNPGHAEVKQLRASALKALGQTQSNPNARHYYLTQAKELEMGLKPTLALQPDPRFLHAIPIENIFKSMAVSLVAEKTLDMEQSVNFTFPDIAASYSINIRRGIAEIKPALAINANIHITTNSSVWNEIAAKQRNPLAAFASGELHIEGSKVDLLAFLSLFEPPDR